MDSKAQLNKEQRRQGLIKGHSQVVPRRHRVTGEAMGDMPLQTGKF